MSSLSIFTSMTNPDKRNDPWKEALNCYGDLADEVVIVGKDWPYEFQWNHIGETFQEGLDKCNSDWVIRMDIDYFFHENNFSTIRNALKRFKDFPVISFPQYQIFTPDRYQIKTRLCIAFNKKKFPNIKLNGGTDLTLATLDNQLLDPNLVPNVNAPVYQYDSVFRTKEIISEDRARFARAWINFFGSIDDRGGATKELAYQAWWKMINERYPKHVFKNKIANHPIYIQEKLSSLEVTQFGYSAFGLAEEVKYSLNNYLKGYREKYLNPILLEKYKYINTYG